MLAAVGLAALSAVVAGGPIAVRPATFGLSRRCDDRITYDDRRPAEGLVKQDPAAKPQ